jgi:hypothetical protein
MIYWIAALSILIAIEFVLAGTCFFLIFPTPALPVAQDFFTTYRHAIVPKHDILFLRLFIIVGVAAFVLLMRVAKRMAPARFSSFKYFTAIDAAAVTVEIFFLFKYAAYRYPLWLNGFYVVLALSVLSKIFSPEIIKILRAFDQRLKNAAAIPNLSMWLNIVGMVLIPLIVWVPDVEGAVARMYFGEQLHHMDWFLMPAGWSHMSGNILGMDNLARYGLGAPIIVAEIAQHILGRFDYVNAVIVMMAISVMYYWIWFYLLRLLFKDTAWALIAILLGIRLQFFNVETFPFIFTYPQDTPLRFFGDSLFFLLMVMHAQTGRMRWLYLMSIVGGFFVFYITGEGLYTLATFYAYLMLREFFIRLNPSSVMPHLNKRQWALLVTIPWMVLLFSLWVVAGRNIFTGLFWQNQFDYIRFYELGTQAARMIDNLVFPYVDRASFAFLLPVGYLFLLVVLLGRLMQKTLKLDGFIMASACIFLLVSYHYHAGVSNNMPSYLRNGVVVAVVIVYVAREITGKFNLYQQRLIKLLGGAAAVIMLVTTHQFLLHPNIFNLSRNPMTHPVVSEVPPGRNSYFNHLFISYPDAFKLPTNGLGEKNEMMITENDLADDKQLKELFRKESDYSQDASLIDSLTAPEAQVPVVSSFENLILMQSRRKPFFYNYFLVNSQPRRMRKFPVTILFTKSNLNREIKRIQDLKPTYIFVEKTYLVSPIPQAYLYDNEDMVDLLSFIFSNYQPYKGGEFLVALKRKGTNG